MLIKKLYLTLGILALVVRVSFAAPSNSLSVPNSFTSNTVISSSEMNDNFNEVATIYNAHGHTDITQVGAITTGTWAATNIATDYGGTGKDFHLIPQGEIIYSSATGTFSNLTVGTKGRALTTGGASANPSWQGMTTQGDIEFHNGTTRDRLAAGTAGKALVTGGAGANPSWQTMNVTYVSGALGTWDTSKSTGNSYLAGSDGFAMAYTNTNSATKTLTAYTDTSNPPTTARQQVIDEPATTGACSVLIPVKKGNYWKIDVSGTGVTATVYWIPLGS